MSASDAENGKPVPGYTSAFGKRFNDLVEALGGEEPASKIAGVSKFQIARWQSGESKPSFFAIAALCAAAGRQVEWLLDGSGDARSEAGAEDELGQFTRKLHAALSRYKAADDGADTVPPTINPDLLVDIGARISSVYREHSVRLPDIDLVRLSGEMYAANPFLASDPRAWPELLDVVEMKIRRQLAVAAADPTSAKRGA